VKQLPALQALRAIAALLVVLGHSVLTLTHSGNLSSKFEPIAELSGGYGVLVFFVISGFIMTYTSLSSFGKRGAVLDFILGRFARIVPIYWLVTIIYSIKAAAVENGVSFIDISRSLLFIPFQNSDGRYKPILGVGWTLNYEMLFYAIFALALFFPPKIGIFLIVIGFIAFVGVGEIVWPSSGQGEGAAIRGVLDFWSEPIILYFVAGVILGTVFLYIQRRGWLFNLSAAIACSLTTSLLLLPAVWFFVSGALLPSAAEALVVVTVCGICVISAPPAYLSRAWTILLLLGDASYSIYLSHGMILGPGGGIWSRLGWGSQFAPAFCLGGLIITAIVGIAIHKFVELPLTRFTKLHIMQARRPKLSEVSPAT
jgi:peptidoglycan/LPS O-acetylase OafA/YrhL